MPDWATHAARLQMLASRQLFFVGGAPRSGTTWLQQMLDAHPQIACRGEGLFLNHFTVPLEKMMRERTQQLEGKNRDLFSHTGGFPVPDTIAAEHLAGTAILLAMAQYGDKPGCRAMGEKTPENVFYFPRLLALFPKARFIAIAREPRDMLSSAWHKFGKPGGREIGDFVRTALPSLELGARAMIAFAESYPNRTRIVTYERLLAEPGPVLTELFEILGVASEAEVVADVVAATRFARVTGGRPPGEVQEGAFLRSGVTGEGKHTFGSQETSLILDQLGWMFSRFGWKY
jgi:hypothetical protein